MTFSADSAALTTLLGLEHAPVAITFHNEVPNNGVPRVRRADVGANRGWAIGPGRGAVCLLAARLRVDLRHGRPQCQILPRAANTGVIAASMGCALSRARTGMSDDELTVAVPGSRVSELAEALKGVCRADDAVGGYAEADLARFN